MSLDPHRTALALGGAVTVLGLVGGLVAWRPEWGLEQFDLDGERNVPATFSALLLLTGAALAVRLPATGVPRSVSLAFGCLLAFAALDEAFELHEKLETRLGVDWQLLYVPVFVLAIVLWCWLVYALRGRRASIALLLAASACWVAAQLLEHEQWEPDGPVPGYTWMMVAEEILEMTGSALLVLGFATASRSLRAAR